MKQGQGSFHDPISGDRRTLIARRDSPSLCAQSAALPVPLRAGRHLIRFDGSSPSLPTPARIVASAFSFSALVVIPKFFRLCRGIVGDTSSQGFPA
jgi:hypothetical protein